MERAGRSGLSEVLVWEASRPPGWLVRGAAASSFAVYLVEVRMLMKTMMKLMVLMMVVEVGLVLAAMLL